MTLYILTKSQHYYPEDGVGDWREVFADKNEGLAALAAMEMDGLSDAFLLHVSPDGFGVVERRSA